MDGFEVWFERKCDEGFRTNYRDIARMAWQAATMAEREACAKHIDVPYQRTGHEFAEAIRARGE